MPKELIKFWRKYKLSAPPFIHPNDHTALKPKDGKLFDFSMPDVDTLISQKRFGPFDDKLNLSLLPVPYVGDLRNAEIVILSLNPGLDYTDYWAETKMPAFRKRLEENLHQSLKGADFPFWALDPQFCWHTGFRWWEKKLHEVIIKIANNKFGKNYFKALQFLSKRLACVELVPYHSSSFRAHTLTKYLPSVKQAIDFARNSLAHDAEAGRRTVIVTRQTTEWGIRGTKSTDDLVIYGKQHARGASLSPKSDGGKAILRRYGIE